MVEGLLEAKSGDLFKKMNFFEKFHFWEPGAEFPYLGITVSVFLHTLNRNCSFQFNFHKLCKYYIPVLKWAHYARKLDIGLLCPNMEIRPRAPKNGIFQNFFIFVEQSPDFASNKPSTTPDIKFKLRQVMQENVILAYYVQIWKFGPKLPKMELFKIFSILWKGLQISLLTSPQPSPDIKFKSSYARKRDYARIWKFSPRLPKMEFFKKFSFF